jgi:hypothetical protein
MLYWGFKLLGSVALPGSQDSQIVIQIVVKLPYVNQEPRGVNNKNAYSQFSADAATVAGG